MQFDILLSTINARYYHTAFGLRYLFANLNELQPKAKIVEYVLGKGSKEIVEELLRFNPKIIGFGVYIWNTNEIKEVVSILKKVAPEIIVVLGGPEVSFETESQPLYQLADFVIKGEADFLFKQFCQQYLEQNILPDNKLVTGPLPEIKAIDLPYKYYNDEDIKNRIIYVEASRGCPFKCEYCLSSLDLSVRNFEADQFLNEIDQLIERGARQFKFVDRTFNLSPTISSKILTFFLARIEKGLFLHFEMVPDRLPDDLKHLIKQFPKGALQFEIGVQTWNPSVAKNVSRRQDYEKIKANFEFLRTETTVHTHADLIVGLPGETKESFGVGFDALAECGPDEIQVGILKRLKGTPIVRHDMAFSMVYETEPPFQILKNKDVNFELMQQFDRFAKFWDLYANSGNFITFTKWLRSTDESFFNAFWKFSEFLSQRHHQTYGIALPNLLESAYIYATVEKKVSKGEMIEILTEDYLRSGPRDLPKFLKSNQESKKVISNGVEMKRNSSTPKRQARHLSEH